jgi:hypothetical protein
MADTKISALAALASTSATAGVLVPVVDTADTSMAASGTDKTFTLAELANALDLLFPSDHLAAIVGRNLLP